MLEFSIVERKCEERGFLQLLDSLKESSSILCVWGLPLELYSNIITIPFYDGNSRNCQQEETPNCWKVSQVNESSEGEREIFNPIKSFPQWIFHPFQSSPFCLTPPYKMNVPLTTFPLPPNTQFTHFRMLKSQEEQNLLMRENYGMWFSIRLCDFIVLYCSAMLFTLDSQLFVLNDKRHQRLNVLGVCTEEIYVSQVSMSDRHNNENISNILSFCVSECISNNVKRVELRPK